MATQRESRSPGPELKRLEDLRIKRAKDGGVIVEHNYTQAGMVVQKPREYTFGPDEGAEALAHIAKHGKINLDEPEA